MLQVAETLEEAGKHVDEEGVPEKQTLDLHSEHVAKS